MYFPLFNPQILVKTPKNKYWPDLIVKDSRLDQPSIFLGGFYTDSNSNKYGIEDCRDELFRAINEPNLNNKSKVIDKNKIIFICHSTGGIVARSVLVKYTDYFQEKNVGLVLMASPSIGSNWANRVSIVARLTNHKLGKQLQWGNDTLVQLDKDFLSLQNSKSIKSLCGIEAYENRFIKKFAWIFPCSTIVTAESANRYFEASCLPDTDHFSTVKPSSIDSCSHKLLIDFYCNTFSNNSGHNDKIEFDQEVIINEFKNINNDLSNKVLFNCYEKDLECYYIKRKIDDILPICAQNNHVWIYGGYGFGKTCLAQRYLQIAFKKSCTIALFSVEKNSIGELITYLYNKLLDCFKPINMSSKNLATKDDIIILLNSYSGNDNLGIFIEEITHLDNDDYFNEFCSFIYFLFMSGIPDNIKIILGTRVNPQEKTLGEFQKLYDKVKCLNCDKWNKNDLESLVEKICITLSIKFTDEMKTYVIDNSNSSPRFIKNFFRNYITLSQANSQTAFQAALWDTQGELRNEN